MSDSRPLLILHRCEICQMLWADKMYVSTAKTGECLNCGSIQNVKSLGRLEARACKEIGVKYKE